MLLYNSTIVLHIMSLKGKIAIVTGAGSGIGRATAVLFSQEGADVVLVGRRSEPLKETLNQINGRGLVVQADVSKSQDTKRIVEETLRTYGRVDILVNNAGVEGPHKPVNELSEEEWDNIIDTNLKGVFLCSKYAIPALKKSKRGVITNVGSNWGIVCAPNASVYCASKAGVILLTKAMAMDVAADGITVNCICPGDTDTPMEHRDVGATEERKADILKKLIRPEEIAHAILYLVSDQAALTTATILVMDNGSSSGESSRLIVRK